jgi:hypothetical protein
MSQHDFRRANVEKSRIEVAIFPHGKKIPKNGRSSRQKSGQKPCLESLKTKKKSLA